MITAQGDYYEQVQSNKYLVSTYSLAANTLSTGNKRFECNFILAFAEITVFHGNCFFI